MTHPAYALLAVLVHDEAFSNHEPSMLLVFFLLLHLLPRPTPCVEPEEGVHVALVLL